MSHTSTMQDVADKAEALFETLATVHRRWILLNRSENGLTERLATYVALRALVTAFDVLDVLENPSEIARLDAVADAFELRTGPADDAVTGRA